MNDRHAGPACRDGLLAVALLYYAPLGTPADEDTLPQVFHWADPNAVTARSSWSDPNATFIGFKGCVRVLPAVEA